MHAIVRKRHVAAPNVAPEADAIIVVDLIAIHLKALHVSQFQSARAPRPVERYIGGPVVVQPVVLDYAASRDSPRGDAHEARSTDVVA